MILGCKDFFQQVLLQVTSLLPLIWASACENLSSGFANNKGADQPAHPHSLISAYVNCLMESIISRLDTGGISIFYIVFVAEETGLKLALTETPKTGFLVMKPI